MNLKIHQRESQDDDNLFVRLHPSTIRKLCVTASHRPTLARGSGDIRSSWIIHDELLNDVQFLPLRIKASDDKWIYCSYNGGFCSKEDTIDVARAIGATIIADVVTVEALSSVQNAKSIQVEPGSTKEWELLEVFAQQLEAGTLLEQVSIVSPGQQISLKLGYDHVQLLVLKDRFCPKEEGMGDDHCLRLVADTEVIVTPRPRPSTNVDADNSYDPSGPIRVLPSYADYTPAMKQLKKLFENQTCLIEDLLPCPPVFTAWMHPETLSTIQGWDSVSSSDPNCSFHSFSPSSANVEIRQCYRNKLLELKERPSTVIELLSSEIIPFGCIVMHPDTRVELTCTALEDFVSVRVLTSVEIQKGHQCYTNAIESSKIVQTLCLTSTMNSGTSPWNFPEEMEQTRKHLANDAINESKVKQYLLHLQNDLVEDDIHLSHGSIISIPDENELSTTRVQIMINTSKQTLRTPPGNAGTSTLYLHPSQLLSKSTIFAKERMVIGCIDPLLNALPSVLPSIEYFISISGFERRLVNSILSSQRKNEVQSRKNYLLCGSKGSGKTFLSLILAARLRMSLSCATHYVDCHQLQSAQSTMEGILIELTRIANKAVSSTPSILILDNLDNLIPNLGTANGTHDASSQQQQHSNPMLQSQSKLLADHTKFLMGELNKCSPVIVLGTCIEENKLHKSLRSVDTFSQKMEVPVLKDHDKFSLFCESVEETGCCSACDELNLSQFASLTKDFLPLDLKNVAAKVMMLHKKSLQRKQIITSNDILTLLKCFIPLSRQALKLEATQSFMSWSDIGGLFKAKEMLSSMILRPIKYRKIFQQAPISLPRGILLFGYPGCGKTCIVPALARECGFNLIFCRGPELLDKYIGASEAKVRLLFERAYAAAPAILFLDEFDALAPRRGSDNTGVTDRVVNQLLTFLDGVEVQGLDSEKMVYIIASSSRPDKIDPALLRPGRLEKHVFIGYTDSDHEWNDLLFKLSKTRNIDEHLLENLSSGSFRELLVMHQYPYRKLSAADLKGVFDSAHINAVHDLLKTKDHEMHVTITCENLLRAFLSTKPSLSESDHGMFSRVFSPFIGHSSSSNDLAGSHPSKLKTALK